jgi:hypothetical protein
MKKKRTKKKMMMGHTGTDNLKTFKFALPVQISLTQPKISRISTSSK